MKRLLYAFALTLTTIPFIVQAQDADEALRYSQTSVGGTARFIAMGGAFSAVGGDMSSLTFNPAGLGVFTKSQLTFSPGYSYQTTSSQFNGESVAAGQPQANIQNAGVVFAWKNSHSDARWKGIAFGFAYNRTNNFNALVNTQGNNNKSTMLDQYCTLANGITPANLDQYYTGPAYSAGLLTQNSVINNSYNNIIRPYLNNGNYIIQNNSLSTAGAMGETDISFGGNYNNKLYLGVTIGIPDINYSAVATYSETPHYTDTSSGLTQWNINSTAVTSGTGINLKLGMIYRITNWARVGLAVHTPTVFSLTDQNYTTITADYDNGPNTQESPAGSVSYTLVTPMRAIAGLAFIIHKHAIISADYEYVDYSTASINAPDTLYSAVNQAIKSSYIAKEDFHLGAEWVLYPFSIRAGYAYYGNPYAAGTGYNTIKRSISGGIGIRIRHCFIDLAYVYSYYNENEYLYTSQYGNAVANNSTTISNIVLTLGVNF
ncbi:MAG: OmpP1/FadL family transporter [Bacteroidia bacterium]